MNLSLVDIGKRFKFHWIFRHINIQIASGQVLAVKGPNGSGKSTLLKILSGFLSPSQGQVIYNNDGTMIKDFFHQVTYAAPYVDLVNQMTLREHLHFHTKFKAFKNGLGPKEVIDILDLTSSSDKALRDFSSGMQQRVKLGLAILSEAEVCILDEPSTNLDTDAFDWYSDLLLEYKLDTAVVIASNEPRDFIQEDIILDIREFKTS